MKRQVEEKEKIKVSIITVCLNSQDTIEETIKSVLEQTYKNIEYIIIDGMSSDATTDIIRKYNEYIYYWVSEKDNGLYDAMNKGIASSTGEIIGIINSDDWYDKHTVQRAVETFEQYDAEVVYGDLIQEYEGEVRYRQAYEPLEQLGFKMVIPHCTAFVKKKVYKRWGGFDLKYKLAADYELMLRLYRAGVKFQYNQEILAHFRMNGLSDRNFKECALEQYQISSSYCDDADTKRKIENLLAINKEFEETREQECRIIQQKIVTFAIEKAFHTNQVVIFGAGRMGYQCYKIFERSNIQVMYFVDNSKEKKGKEFVGKKIYEASFLKADEKIVIAMKEHANEVAKQLEKLGKVKNKDYIIWDEFWTNLKEGSV